MDEKETISVELTHEEISYIYAALACQKMSFVSKGGHVSDFVEELIVKFLNLKISCDKKELDEAIKNNPDFLRNIILNEGKQRKDNV